MRSDRIDFCDIEARRDPYPLYARLRRDAPVHRGDLGFWLLLRHRDCTGVLKDAARWSADSRNAAVDDDFEEPSPAFGGSARVYPHLFWDPPRLGDVRPFMFLDDPDHRRVRSLVGQAFTRSALLDKGPHVEALAHELLERCLARPQADLVEGFAYPLPLTVICELLGVPPRDIRRFGAWSRPLGSMLTPDYLLTARERERSRRALIGIVRYLGGLMAERRDDPGDDLLGALIAAEQDGETLTAYEVVATALILLIAGHETTVNLIANGTLALLAHPEQREALAADPTLARRAVDETLRYDAPVQLAARTALEDVEIGGQRIRRGEHALMLIAAANRDPELFDEPDRFDIHRANGGRHIAFGSGLHACVGSVLGQIEGQAGLRAVAARLDGLELAAAPHYRRDPVLRGPERLILRRIRARRPECLTTTGANR